TTIAPPAGVPSGATTTVGPSATQASRTSASIACASSARASRRSRPSRLLPSTPLNGTTTVGIARDPTAAAPGDGSGAARRRERLERPEERLRDAAGDQRPRGAERRQVEVRLDATLPVRGRLGSDAVVLDQPELLVRQVEVGVEGPQRLRV